MAFWLGTVKVPPYSNGTCSSLTTELYDPKTFITHAALLRQTCVHCGRFPTAASRRSLGRFSVPVWLVILTDQLPVSGLVGHYPANNLMGRTPVPARLAPLVLRPYAGLAHLSVGYPPRGGWFVRATQPFATHCPKAVRSTCMH